MSTVSRNTLREPGSRAASAQTRTGSQVGRKPGARRASTRSRGPKIVTVLAVLLLAIWAVVATAFAISGRLTAERLAEEQTELRLAHEDKVKALTRRLVGVASHQILEQDGLSGRLADIIARQVEAENRQSALVMMTDRLNAAGLPGAPAPASATGPARSIGEDDRSGGSRARSPAPAPEVPALRLGGPSPLDPATANPATKPRSSLEEPAGRASPASRAARVLQAAAEAPLREQFAVLEASIGRLEVGQVRLVGAFSSGIHNGIGTIRTALSGLGLAVPEPQVQPKAEPERRGLLRLSAARPPADPFEAKLASLEGDFLILQRWKALVDAVPIHRPVQGDNNLTSNFGTRKDPFTGEGRMHAGIDFRGPIGTPIHAAGSGRVITADVTGGYGNLVEVEHGNGLVTRYAHLSAIQVATGATVTPGTVVGLLGSTGRSTGPHLHYETRLNGTPLDPMKFMQAGAQLLNQSPPAELSQDASSEEGTFD